MPIRGLVAWSILIGMFLLAGEGFNIMRVHLMDWLAFGHIRDVFYSLFGLLLAFAGTAFLAGFVYFRDKKRGKLKREGWRGRPVQKKPAAKRH